MMIRHVKIFCTIQSNDHTSMQIQPAEPLCACHGMPWVINHNFTMPPSLHETENPTPFLQNTLMKLLIRSFWFCAMHSAIQVMFRISYADVSCVISTSMALREMKHTCSLSFTHAYTIANVNCLVKAPLEISISFW